MAQRDDEAIEIASIMDNVISDAVAAENRPTNMADTNVGNNGNKTKFDCLVPDCDYVTLGCDLENVASDLLALHINVMHKEQPRGEKNKHINKILVPEALDLDPSEDNDEEFGFWLTRFMVYLSECGVDQPAEMYQKLKSRLSFKVFQYICDALDFKSLVAALEKLYIKKKNVFATRNKLLSCKQSTNENVKTYLQRLNNLAKYC